MRNHSTEDFSISRQFGSTGYEPVRQQGDSVSAPRNGEAAKEARDRGRNTEDRGYTLQMS